VVLRYQESPARGALREAEVLRDVIDVHATGITWGDGGVVTDVSWAAQVRPFAVVMTQDCDLEQDFNLRFPADGQAPAVEEAERHPNALQTIVLCEAFDLEELASRVPADFSKLEKKMARRNQNERYHCLMEGTPPGSDPLPGLVLDLRTPFSVPVMALYEQLDHAGAKGRRAGIIPEIHSHDLIHRFYSYQARVALPPEGEPPLLGAGVAEVQHELEQISASGQAKEA
jgi:hypothetical protein